MKLLGPMIILKELILGGLTSSSVRISSRTDFRRVNLVKKETLI
jgi:hypothetical protein